MNYYAAPLEGITGYVFRTAHHRFFPDTDKYFIPFIEPKPLSKKIFNARELNDVLPEHNKDIYVVPQILTNKAEDFIWTGRHLIDYGYKELNLNLGCPSKTVVSKNRGSGFLALTDELKRFLDTIFSKLDVEISIKTRLGKYDTEEFSQLLDIYNQFPLKELIIHPRTQQEFYKGQAHVDVFKEFMGQTNHPLCYNGDLFSKNNYDEIIGEIPNVNTIMIGRGLLINPGLIHTLKTGELVKKEQLLGFHNEIYHTYLDVFSGGHNVIMKMKEIWCYLIHSFKDSEKLGKKIKKASNLNEYNTAVAALFDQCSIEHNPIYYV